MARRTIVGSKNKNNKIYLALEKYTILGFSFIGFSLSMGCIENKTINNKLILPKGPF